MRILISLFSFLLSLVGCDQRGSNSITTSSIDGVEVLHSVIASEAEGMARFECAKSTSGHCSYVVFASNCPISAPSAGTTTNICTTEAISEFSVEVGESKDLIGLPIGFRHCVGQDKAPVAPYCIN